MVTLKQLAKELNVSISTVSKALNDSHEIGDDTIKRVKELAALYHYQPNKVALSLKQNKTKTIGVIIPDILEHFFAKVLFGIEKEANLQGYNIITCISNDSLDKEKQSLQLLANGSVDGFILSVADETQQKNEVEHFKNTISQGLPIVMFDRVAHDVMCDKVIVDDFDATYKATLSLMAEKRKRIAFISSIETLSVGKLRERGYLKAILEHTEYEPIILKLKRTSDAQKKIKSFFKKYGPIDGIISADSASGVVAINTAVSLKLKVPKDISVIGFATKTFSNFSIPRLTTVSQHGKTLGSCAAKMLIDRLENRLENPDFKTVIIKTSLLKNKSTLK